MPSEIVGLDYERLTLISALAMALVFTGTAFMKGWIVPGTTYERDLDEMRQERDYEREEKNKWQSIAFQAIRSTESLATTAEAAAAAFNQPPVLSSTRQNRTRNQ